jgi:drug/metabolite transporter (DMT)-like permease
MTAADPQHPNLATELALLLALATLWGASYTFIRVGVATIPPITLIAGRTAIAGLLLLAIMRWRGVTMPTDLATWRRFLFQAGMNSVVPWTMVAWGERTLDAGLATILNSTAPIFTFFLTLVIRHEAVTSRKIIGVAAGMIGICLIVGHQALSGLGEQLTAQLVTLAAAVCYAGAAIFGRGFRGLDPMAPAAGSLLCGAAILIPLSLVVEQPWMLTPSTNSLLALLGLAVFSTAFAFVIYFRLIQTLGSVGTTAQAYLRVPIGVGLGAVFLGERPSATAWIGLACVVVGVAAMTIPARKAPARAVP